MLELLIAAAFGGYAAPECPVAFERRKEVRLVLVLRPACPLGRASTAEALRMLLLQADANEISVAFGRLEHHPWLSNLLARQASSSRRWDLGAGRPHAGSDNAYVAAALEGMPEFTALFGRWRLGGVSVEKVLLKPARDLSLPAGAPVPPDAKLPYDAIVWVYLKQP
jgi:hypothetical protein